MMKKIFALSLIGGVTSLMAMYAEQAYLYKDSRILGAGGANTAIGGYSTSIFYNPAGLRSIKKEHGFVVDLLGLQASGSKKVQDFVNDMQDALDQDSESALVDVFKKYDGEHFHIDLTNYSALSKNSDFMAWSVGLLVGADANYMTHMDATVNALSALETTSRGYGGVFVGFAKDFDTSIGKIDLGVSGKYVKQKSYEGLISSQELATTDDLVDYLQTNYEKDGSGYGIDIGAIYHVPALESLRPTIGVSVLNIGDMKMDEHYGRQPMTVNVGFGLSPEVPIFDRLTIGVDFVDVLSENKVRVYDYNPEGEAFSYVETKNDGFMKKMRAGATLGVYDSSWLTLDVSGGWYQESYTAGVNMELTVVKLSFATYEEDLGYGAADYKDRRYALQLGIGW